MSKDLRVALPPLTRCHSAIGTNTAVTLPRRLTT